VSRNKLGLFVVTLVGAVVLGLYVRAGAQFVPTYAQKSTSVASSSSPVAVIPAGSQVVDWFAKPRSSPAADNVLCWWFTGAVPSATPSPAAVMELVPSGSWYDQWTPPVSPPNQQGLACVLESGSTAITVDAAWR